MIVRACICNYACMHHATFKFLNNNIITFACSVGDKTYAVNVSEGQIAKNSMPICIGKA